MAKNWREVLRVDRIIHTSLWIGVLCLVIVGCIPEGVDIPGTWVPITVAGGITSVQS